jgi:TonB-linked SusC/RagA family outer membrane protein
MKKRLYSEFSRCKRLIQKTGFLFSACLAIMLLTGNYLFAQTSTIQGKVSDSKGALPGVSVRVDGSTVGVSTDADGNYSISAPANGTLVFSSIGYNELKVPVNNRQNINVTLETESQSLSEVVVIGYGTVKKSDLTGATSTVKAERLLDQPVTNVSQALQGKVAGVDVNINTSAPGESARIRIRGIGSIGSSLDPLYVVDGVIGVDATTLNPNDIESIEVLKDASSTAIYGARGNNGVIMVTTKRGIKGKTRVSFDSYASVNTLQRHLKTLNAREFMEVYNLAYQNAEKYDSLGFAQGKYIPNDPRNLPNLFDANGNPLYDTNWEKEVYKPALSNSQQLTLQGGSENVLYSLSLGYLDQNGLMTGSWFNRYSARFTMDDNINKWLKIGGSLSTVRSTERLVSDANGGLNVSRMVIEGIPIIPVKYPDGTWGGNGDFPGMEGGSNPVNIAQNRFTLKNLNHSLGNAYAQLQITEDLTFKSDFGFDVLSGKNNFYSGRELSSLSANDKGQARLDGRLSTYWQSENYLTWNKKISDRQSLTALLGISWQKTVNEYQGSYVTNFIDDFWQWHNLGAGTGVPNVSSSDNENTMNSYFGRISYNIDEKYLFTATGRYDGSSKFGTKHKYGFFPSIGAAWRISQEEFLKDNPTISNLKLRASAGSTGNQEIGTYRSIQFLGSGTTLFDGTRQPTIFRTSFGNPNLKWERSNQFDIGLDVSFLNDRINLTADYYHKTTKDLLLDAPIPWSTGLSSVTENIGSVRNTGVELALNTQNIRSDNFNWSTDVIFTANKNQIIKLGVSNDDIYPGPWFLGQTNILRVGWPIGTFWGYIRDGVWGTDEAAEAATYNLKPGDLKWRDLNNDGKIDDADNTRLGQAYPKFTMNVSNTLNYKNFDFTFDIRFVSGVNTVANYFHSTEDRQAIANSLASVLDAWTPQNQNSSVAEVRYYGSFYQTHIDSHWVQDGSYIRGQNFILGYTLPASTMDRLKIQKLRVYVSAQNLFLITNYSGYDPEVNTFDGQLTQNQDFFPYPRPRVFNLGLNLTF